VREVAHFAMRLFVEGEEEPLGDEKRLSSASCRRRRRTDCRWRPCSRAAAADWTHKGGWMTDADLGEWQGVTMDAEGRVVKLCLSSEQLGRHSAQ
jgi:hypothetical protein